MPDNPDIRRKRRRRILLVTLVLLVLVSSAGGFYAWRMQSHAAHLATFKPRGLEKLEQGDYPAALHLLGSYLNHEPNDLDALRGIADARPRVYAADGAHVTQTVSVLRRIVQLDPGDEAAQRELLDLYVTVGFNTEAVEMAEPLLAQDPDDRQALRAQAQALWQKRSYERALETAARYTELEPEDTELQLLALAIMDARNQPARQIVGRARALVEAYPEDGRFLMVLGAAHELVGERNRAREHYQQAAEHLPGEAEEVGRLARRMDGVGLFREATELLRQAERALDDPALVRLLVRRLWEQGRTDLLVERAETFDLEDPQSDSEAMAVLAVVLVQAGERERAEAFIDELARRPDGVAQAWETILRVIAQPEVDTQRLVSVASTALLRHPHHPYFHYFHGMALADQGDVEAAIEAWQTAAGRAPSWAGPLLRVTRAFLNTERASLAIEVARAAVQRAPDSGEATVTLLEAYAANLDQIDDEQAEQLARMIERMAAETPAVRRRLLPLVVEVRARRGERDEAAGLIRSALELDPSLSANVLLQLARVSHTHELGLTDACLDAAEVTGGMTPRLAYIRAHHAGEQQQAEQIVARFDDAAKAADASDPRDKRAWALTRARLLEAVRDEQAVDYWRQLLEQYADDRHVLEAAVASGPLWEDRSLASQAVRQLGEVAGEQAVAWRVARAKLLLQSDRVGERSLAEASLLLLEVTRQMPYMIEPRLLLAQTYERMDQPERALEVLEQAHRLSPHATSIALDRARLLQATGEADAAGRMLARVRGTGEFSPSQKLQVATLLAHRGELDAAEQMLQDVLALAPGHRHAKLLLANLHVQQGHSDAADALYRTLLETPDEPVITAAAAFYERQGDVQQAGRLLEQLNAVEIAPDRRAMIRAAFHQRQGDPGQAIAELAAAAAQGDVAARLWGQLIVLQLHAGQTAEALATAKRAAVAHPDEEGFTTFVRHQSLIEAVAGEATLRALAVHIVVDPEHRDAAVEALRLVFEADRRQRQTREVAVDLRRIAERHPRFLPLQNLMVRVYQAMERHDDAADLALRTMRALPDTPQAMRPAAEALMAAERWDEALQVARQMRRRAADPLEADLMIAEAQIERGRGGAAADQLRPHLEAGGSAGARFNLLRTFARAMLADGQAEAALAALEPTWTEGSDYRQLTMRLAVLNVQEMATGQQWLSALESAWPDDAAPGERLALAQAWRGLDERFGGDENAPHAVAILTALMDEADVAPDAAQMLGMIHESQGRLDEAEAAYRAALGGNPDLAISQNNLAVILVDRGEPAEALRLARQATEAHPRFPAFQDTLATALLANDQPDAAVEAAQRAVSLEPGQIEWRLTLGEALVQAGQSDQARELLEWLDEHVTDATRLSEDHRARLESLREAVPVAGAPSDRTTDARDPLASP